MSMTQCLYLLDTYLYEHPAVITEIGQEETKHGVLHYIVLDQTIFYPQGGGQPSDCGEITVGDSKISISMVKNSVDGKIRHYLSSDSAASDAWSTVFSVNSAIHCVIDPLRRQCNARFHTAAHLLSNVVETMYPGMKATKGHSFPGEAYIELTLSTNATEKEKPPTIDTETVATAVDEAIKANLVIKVFEMTATDFSEQFYSLPVDTSRGPLRFVQIGTFLPIPCGGTHLSSTADIRRLSISKAKVKNGITKISYDVEKSS